MMDQLVRLQAHAAKVWAELSDQSSRLSRRTVAWTSLALAAVILLSVNLISSIGLRSWSADLTQDSLFTISDGTKQVLRSIDEPVTARIYFSGKLAEASPDYARYFERVRTLFEQYRDISSGKLQLSFLNPEPFSDAEDRAMAAGLRGLRINSDGELGYFGLVANNATDNQEVISLFAPDRESFLEYDVTKLIHTLANPKKRVVGLMTGLPLDGGKAPMGDQPLKPWLIMSQIREFFDVETVPQDVKEIPANVNVLMVAEPSALTADAALAIDQFALKGGRVLLFVDPLAESAQLAMLQQQGDGAAQMTKLLAGWGVAYDDKKAVADLKHARRVQFGQSGQGSVTDFVAWLGLDKSSINPRDVLSAGIEVINVASAGYFGKAEGSTVTLSPILESSPSASVIGTEKLGFGADPIALLRNYSPGTQRLVLAARLSGEVKSAFPGGAPGAKDEAKVAAAGKPEETAKTPASAPEAAKKPHVTSGKINAIVVADTDILADQFWVDRRQMMGQEMVMPSAHNAAFVVGALENLSGSDALIALRSRGVRERPFTWVADLRRQAERQFREKEQALEQKLKETQAALQRLQSTGDGANIALSEQERKAIEDFRGQMFETRRELRDVKLALGRDIDSLDRWLKFANIGFVPILLVLIALGWMVFQNRNRHSKSK